MREAVEKGYAEPDAREDLSGHGCGAEGPDPRAAARLPRAGAHARRAWCPAQLRSVSIDQFFAKLPAFDKEWADRAAREKRKGRVLRYVVTATPRSVSAKLVAVPASSPMGSLEGTRNLIAFTTRRYRNEPLVVSGPGAGTGGHGAGILNDIYSLAGR